ncbi:MAG: ABC transporter substrate-binding protein [Candidatus Thorarchaeota archaeon]
MQNTTTSDELQLRPYIDRIVYRHTDDVDTEIILLLSNQIDTVLSFYNPEDMLILDQDPDIDLFRTTGNGYWCIDFDCGNNYPVNISGFRRAFAYAFDKTSVISEFPTGQYSVHDSVVSSMSSFCIENELGWHYYTNRADIGNQILDDLGFTINSTTGWRSDPNGESFKIDIDAESYSTYFPPTYLPIVHSIANAAKDAFNELHIDAQNYVGNFLLQPPTPVDLLVHDTYFDDNDIDWLGNDQSLISFSNASFNLYLDDLLFRTSYDAVFEAGAEIQRILHSNVPRLVVCSELLVQPYRTDKFTGLIEDVRRGVSGIWSLCNMRNTPGNTGGTVRIGFHDHIHSFNFYTDYAQRSKTFLDNIWPTLFTIGPNMELIPNLATYMRSETHADNSAVPEGHMRVTVDILHNATWSDGVPLTAEDVVFTLLYEIESEAFGNPAARNLQTLAACFSPTPNRVVFEYNTESYWHQFNRATSYLLPKHVFNDIDGIGYEGWDTWNPVFNPDVPLVTCGPFIIDEEFFMIDDDHQDLIALEMVRNPNYYYYVNRTNPVDETELQTSTTPGTLYPLSRFSLGFYSSITICVIIILFLDHRREKMLAT